MTIFISIFTVSEAVIGIAYQFSTACTKSIGSVHAHCAFPRWSIALAGGAGIPRRSSPGRKLGLQWSEIGIWIRQRYRVCVAVSGCIDLIHAMRYFWACDSHKIRLWIWKILEIKFILWYPYFLQTRVSYSIFQIRVAGPPITLLKFDILGYIFHCKFGSSVTLAWYGMCGICDMLLCDVF